MTTTSAAEFIVTLNAGQAQRELNKTRDAAFTLGGGLEKLDRASTVAAKGIGAMGPALGAASRSSSELLRGIGDLAGLLGSGGLFGVAIAGAAWGVTKLVDEFGKADRAAAAAFRSMRKISNDELAAVAENIRSIERQIASFGKSTAQVTRDQSFDALTKAQMEERDAQQAILFLRERAQKVLAEVRSGDKSNLKQEHDQIMAQKAAQEERLNKAKAMIPLREKELKDAEELLRLTKEREDAVRLANHEPPPPIRPAAIRSEKDVITGGHDDMGADGGPDDLEAQEKRNAAIVDAEHAKNRAIAAAQRKAGEEMLAERDRQSKEAIAIAEREMTETVNKYAALSGGIAVLTGELAANLVSGQEDAWGQFLAGAASQAGQYIILEGAKVLATGIEGALTGNPAAPAQIAGGLGLMAAGGAIQAGGAAAAQQMVGAGGGGGGSARGGGGGGGSARREPGVNRSRGSRERPDLGGAATINIVYSAAGPRPEDTGRAVNDALETHRRRTGRIG